jgi:hypothetical protein
MITYTTTERPPRIVNPRLYNELCLAAGANYDLGLHTLGDDDQDLLYLDHARPHGYGEGKYECSTRVGVCWCQPSGFACSSNLDLVCPP